MDSDTIKVAQFDIEVICTNKKEDMKCVRELLFLYFQYDGKNI